MLTDTTVADVKAQLGWMVPSEDELLQNLNQALSSAINNGLWEGVIRKVIFQGSTTGFITLPPYFSSIIGATLGRCPQMVFNQYFPYIESGPGILELDKPSYGPLQMLGDSFVTSIADHIPGQQLRFRTSSAFDSAKVIRIFGTNTSDGTIFDTTTGVEGQNLTLTSLSTFPTNLNLFLGIQKPAMIGTLSVYSWDGVKETLLSVYQPWEVNPHYTRYQTGTLDATIPITCLCRIGYRPVIYDTDFVIPGDINFLEFALQAIDCQHSRHTAEAQQAWKQAFDQLNQEVRALRGKAQPTVTLLGPLSNKYRLHTN